MPTLIFSTTKIHTTHKACKGPGLSLVKSRKERKKREKNRNREENGWKGIQKEIVI